MKRAILIFLASFVVGLSGVATAAVFSGSGSPSPNAGGHGDKEAADEAGEDSGVHGGTIDRFHQAGGCGLTATGGLQGNWTHGDYVNAVSEGGGTAKQIQAAAHSDCGKPMVSVGHGPPPHALEHMAAGKAHAGGNGGDESPGD